TKDELVAFKYCQSAVILIGLLVVSDELLLDELIEGKAGYGLRSFKFAIVIIIMELVLA
ncbi:21026_t:CDS:1, partial [Racocetra persica]